MDVIKLMPEYECWPLWHSGPNNYDNIDPRFLGLSDKLVEEIENWAAVYDATLDQDYPPNSAFKSSRDERLFADDGFSLAEKIYLKLTRRYQVIFK
ncbi:hypothetical protein GCM10007207_19190 [Asaia siamensis]|uniref:Uncharacterized protein n=1 Tax=Asaia siamensis TaxID=110479 RepID=A0ABQ1M505_9PROT|nr:hypothetical protein AA0323_2857 [Asaia siamensis NRIC 0323]GGC33797.1 hypothetical protein GCM10007207_19190 [Asaia siamensis]